MDARELVAAIRAEHLIYGAGRGVEEVDCLCGEPWPCMAIIAADRIEAALAVLADPDRCLPSIANALHGPEEYVSDVWC